VTGRKLLWWSNAPWDDTGYGVQTALFLPLIQQLGYEVATCAFHGLQGNPTMLNGIPVYPASGRAEFSLDLLDTYYRHWQADAVITLMDTWKLEPEALGDGMRVACWTPVDCHALGAADKRALKGTGAIPIAMSKHGYTAMTNAGFDAWYVPHGVDTTVFSPPADRKALRAEMGLSGKFVVGINAANRDTTRKGFPEQFWAFAEFAERHSNAVLLVNSAADNVAYGGLDLMALARDAGITDRIGFCDQGAYLAGMFGQDRLAAWYGALDILSNCSWGEGFGLPVIEAQACGTPVVVTNGSAMAELAGAGWRVAGERAWHYGNEARWTKPRVADIARAYGQAAGGAAHRRARAREFALQYDAAAITRDYWAPALEGIFSAPATAAAEGPDAA